MDWRHLGAESSNYKLYLPENSKSAGIKLKTTDAGEDEIRIPAGKDVGRTVHEDGTYDYYEESASADVSRWRTKIGLFALDWLFHPGVVHDRDECVLKSLPKGYKLFTHHKRYRDEEGHERERKDHYLMGSSVVYQFRSPEEFILHFRWLMTGKPMKDGQPECLCTYCSGTPQGEISKKYANYRQRSADPESGSDHNGDKKRRAVSGRSRRPASPPLQIKDYRHLATSTASTPFPLSPAMSQTFASSLSAPLSFRTATGTRE